MGMLIPFSSGHVFDSCKLCIDACPIAKPTQRLSDSKELRISAHPNGSPDSEGPVVGSLMIWKPQGFFKVTGHVAVVVDVNVRFVDTLVVV